MKPNTTNQSPAQVADEYEMLAQLCTDEGDAVLAEQYMKGARVIRQTLRVLTRVSKEADFSQVPGLEDEVDAVLANTEVSDAKRSLD